MRFLITGANGQLGRDLVPGLESRGEVIATTRDGSDVDGRATVSMDLSLPLRIQEVAQEFKPDVIINAAAYTAVDRAEEETELAHQVNAVAPGVLAEEALSLDALLVHFSTDYVFSGVTITNRAWRESDPTVPVNVYGHTKLGGEEMIRQTGGAHLILRTSWVYAAHGQNFPRTMLRLARERDELQVVNDQTGAPTWTKSLTAAVIRILGQLDADRRTPTDALGDRSGTYHLSAGGETTWFDYARKLFELAQAAGLIERIPRLQPASSQAFGAKARRPASSALDSARMQKTFGVTLPAWQDDLARCIQEMAL